jgi:hypothetical protein
VLFGVDNLKGKAGWKGEIILGFNERGNISPVQRIFQETKQKRK